MKSTEFAKKCEEVLKYKTVYASGTFGQKALPSIIDAKAKQYPKWYTKDRIAYLKSLPDDTRMFDCCGLIKAVCWGFPNTVYGSNGCPDKNDQGLWDMCKDKSQSFSNIQVGEMLWMKGHVGVYLGNGKGIECTPSWKNGVQITAVAKMGAISGLHSRSWAGHGKLPFIDYGEVKPAVPDYSKYPILKKGSRNSYVTILQKILVEKGYDPKGIDGIFGPGCLAAVKQFQKDNGLVVDGCVGPKTWAALYK